MRFVHATVGRVLLVAMLVSLPGRIADQLVCMRGMVRPGVTCPLCKAHAAAAQNPAAHFGNNCCKIVPGRVAPVPDLASTQANPHDAGALPTMIADAALRIPPARVSTVLAAQRASPRTPGSAHLTILRL